MHHHLRRVISRTTQPLSSVNNSTNIENEKNKKKSSGAPGDEIFIEEDEDIGVDDVIEDEEGTIDNENEPMDLENSDPVQQKLELETPPKLELTKSQKIYCKYINAIL